jgi:hypothetical protein
MDPVVGDPLSPGSLNRFVYGLANPVTYSDTFGLYACEPGLICKPEAFQSIPDFTQDYLVPAAETNVALSHVAVKAIDPPEPVAPPVPRIILSAVKGLRRALQDPETRVAVGRYMQVKAYMDACGGPIDSIKCTWKDVTAFADDVWEGTKDVAGEAWEGAKKVGGAVLSGAKEAGKCMLNLVACAESIERIVAVPVVFAAGLLSIGAAAAICVGSGTLACALAVPTAGAAGVGGIYAGVEYTRELWRDRHSLFNYEDWDEQVREGL